MYKVIVFTHGDLGGGLHLDSTPGQGTTIRVTVPLEPQEE